MLAHGKSKPLYIMWCAITNICRAHILVSNPGSADFDGMMAKASGLWKVMVEPVCRTAHSCLVFEQVFDAQTLERLPIRYATGIQSVLLH